jgi:6,7-dimethyl-8-ribityllumazine synthase
MKKKICIVLANYYPDISKNLLNGALKSLKKKGFNNCKVISSPGVFEIPIIISRNIKYYDAFIALGCVIKGETPHFHYISKSSINGIMNLSISNKKPIGNGIITSLNYKQAIARANPKNKDKGGEAAKAIISVLSVK